MFDEIKTFLSSPRSLELVELKKTKKKVKREKRLPKRISKSIYEETDLSKLTPRQRILHQKYQEQKEGVTSFFLLSNNISVDFDTKKNKHCGEDLSKTKSKKEKATRAKKAQKVVDSPQDPVVCTEERSDIIIEPSPEMDLLSGKEAASSTDDNMCLYSKEEQNETFSSPIPQDFYLDLSSTLPALNEPSIDGYQLIDGILDSDQNDVGAGSSISMEIDEDLDVIVSMDVESPFNIGKRPHKKNIRFPFESHSVCEDCFDDAVRIYVHLEEMGRIHTCSKYGKLIMMHKSKIRQNFKKQLCFSRIKPEILGFKSILSEARCCMNFDDNY